MAPYYGSNVRFQNHVNHHTGRLTFHGCWHRSVVPEYKWCPMWAMFCILDLSHVTSAAVRNSLTAHRRSSVLRGRQRITLSSQNSPWRPCMDYGWGWLDDKTLLMLPNFEVCLWCCVLAIEGTLILLVTDVAKQNQKQKANYWYFVAGEMAGASFKRSHFSIVVVPLCGTTPEIQPGSEYPGSAHKSLIQLHFPMKCMT